MKRLVFMVSALATPVCGLAQNPASGLPPYGSFEVGKFDTINRQNLNINFAIPIVSSPGRGMNLQFSIVYDSLVWGRAATFWYPASSGIWGWKTDSVVGTLSYSFSSRLCRDDGLTDYHRFSYSYSDEEGTEHKFAVDFWEGETACNFGPIGPRTGVATDGSGYQLDATNTFPDDPIVSAPNGIRVNLAQTRTDTNGNFVSKVANGSITTWKDTVGRDTLIIDKSANPQVYKYPDTSGSYQQIRVTYQSFSIRTNFQCAGVIEYTGTASLPVSIDLPNQQSYAFTYEDTPGSTTGEKTGRLKRVTLPTGGFYEYQYPTTGNGGINCAEGTVTSLDRIVNDGTASATWQFRRVPGSGADGTTTVTAPKLAYDSVGNDSVYTFDANGHETARNFYQGSSNPTSGSPMLLRMIGTAWATNGTPATRTVVMENNQQAKTETDLDTFGNLLALREYDWGTSAPGSLVRTTTLTYMTAAAYTDRNIRDRVSSILVADSVGVKKAETLIDYDQGAITSSGGTPAPQHDYVRYPNAFTTRGNPTTVRRWVSGTTYLATAFTYDDLGNLRSTTDPGSHTTNLAYDDNYSDGINTRNTFAYLTRITKATPFDSQTISLKYHYAIGQLASLTDENSQATSFSYTDALGNPERMNRLKKADFPDGGQITISYDDTLRTVSTTQKRTATENGVVTDVFNQLGLLVQRQLPGGRMVDITYDPLGRQWKISNPYLTTTESTYGQLETQFDALGRAKKTLNQDGTFVGIEYAGNATKLTDETGKQRLSQTDALGRLIKVCEVTAGNTRSPAESCGITGFGGSGYLTTNIYDVLDNFSQIAQGAQTRTATYDGVSRLTTAKIIEVSAATNVTYGYDDDGNRTSVTDPRGTVNFEYDALHRLKIKKHGLTLVAEYTYDGATADNGVGRLKTETDGAASSGADKTDYTFDAMGRVKTANRTVSSAVYAMGYGYDLAGNLTSLSYPSGRVVEYGYNPSGELSKVTDGTDPAARFDYVTGTVYSPLGPLAQLDLANSVRTTLGWNNRGLLTSLLTQKVTGTTHLSLSYSYFNNGATQQVLNNLDSLKSEKYTYDELQRLLTAQRGPDSNIQRKYFYDYDRYGNRWGQSVVAGSGYNGQLGFDATNNRVTSPNFGYDGSGNVTANGPATSYVYNPENFMTAASSTSYTYDAQGRRVRKTVGTTVTDYFYSGAQLLAEKQATQWTDYIFFGNQRIAQQTGSTASTATYLHTDHLGSTRICTNASGDANGTCDYEPFGEVQPGSACSLSTNFRFAGMEWDADAGPNGLYHTWFRQYDVNQGRWMSVDPLPGGPADPPSLDRYAYVLNDPANLTDPVGLCACLQWRLVEGEAGAECVRWFGDCDSGSGPVTGTGGCDRNQTRDVQGNPCPGGGEPQPPARQPQIGPAPPVRPRCRIVDPILGALEFTFKLGLEASLSKLKIGGSIFKNQTTGETGGQITADLGLIGGKISRAGMGSGGSPEFSGSLVGFEKNLSTGITKFSPSKEFLRIGGALGVGLEISFNPDTFKAIAEANDRCRAAGGR